ncbi:TPA: LysR family transcriptional regulator [Legionella pneumophila]|nr:LysR family transcriptional regulator [Legionella pneumophila]
MELRHLRYLLAVYEQRNFTRASELLYVSQPTLSQQIGDLEEELGCLLFHREYHQLIPTEAAEIACNYAKESLGIVQELKNSLLEMQGLQRGCLKLGVIQTFNAFYLSEILSQFLEKWPEIDIEVEELANNDISKAVLAGRLHLGIGFTASDNRMHKHKLYDEDILIACNTRHRFAQYSEINIQELADEMFLTLPQQFTIRQWVDELMAKHRTVPRRIIEFNTIIAILSTLHKINGVAVLPAVTKRALPNKGLHFARLLPALPMRSVSLHRLPSSNCIPLVSAFEQHLLLSFK